MEKEKLKKQVNKLCQRYSKDKKIVEHLTKSSLVYIGETFRKLEKDISAIHDLYINGRGDMVAIMTDKTEIVIEFPD